MNRSRRNKSSSGSGLPDSPTGQQSRPNRLRRSYRPSQQTQAAVPERIESPKSRQSDFKTPTRVPRSRAAGSGGFSQESPHNDSDFQHDIIWDPTSPLPNRAGKRGQKQRGSLVDISEIVNRIAPKHGRPEVVEPTLQRWIGDSAAIPCTPDVQAPKAKKKSPRPNGVDDLLKLARQFDLNLFHQSDGAEDELLPQDVLTPGDAEVQPDDLDFLFDGPTQQLSVGALSQPLAEPAESAPPPGSLASVAFEDDWDDDDFLNDSLVLEATQNPLQQNFADPKFCSTQKPLGSAGGVVGGTCPPAGTPGSDQNSSVRREREEPQRNRFPLVPVRSRWTQHEPRLSHQTSPIRTSPSSSRTFQKPPCHYQEPADLLDDDELLAAFWSQPVRSEQVQSEPVRSEQVQSEPVRSEQVQSEQVWSEQVQSEPVQSQPVWDDPADDYLLCEVCEDMENQIVVAEQTVAPSRNHWTLPASAGSSLASRSVVGVVSATAAAGPSAARGPWLPLSVQRGPFTFKKPSGPVSTVSCQVAVAPKCSAAEIEKKKQQAIERRRQRLQAAANTATAAT